MSNLTALKEMRANKVKGKIDVAGLTRDMFKNEDLILNRFFRFNGKDITRFHIPKLTKEEYESEIKRYSGKVSDSNKKFEDATAYFKQKMAIERTARDLGKTVKQLDFSSYLWNDDYFTYDDLLTSAMYVDNKFMEENDDKYDTPWEAYIGKCSQQSAFPKELYDELYSFCVEVVKQRKVMLYCKVEQCVSILRMLVEYTDGFNVNTSGNMVDTLRSYREYFNKLITDEEFIQFVSNNSDIDVYTTEDSNSDYISTYASVIRALTGVDCDCKEDSIEFVRGLIHNDNDPYEEQILERLYENRVEFISYIEDLEDNN